ncbi:hypothetical protein [Desulfosporosinus orientis]|uniref:hypothetical protein n=1 Tax=Desulfosporosinus orientis TaxID=1563 RepID=UPI0002F1FA52|nr:hypothetical protein [Desulfosporosinus orientis]
MRIFKHFSSSAGAATAAWQATLKKDLKSMPEEHQTRKQGQLHPQERTHCMERR